MADADNGTDTTITEQLLQATAATRVRSNGKGSLPQPSDLRVLALALKAYATWIERDPNTYDADELARALEKAGIIDHYEWAPSSWVVDAVQALRGH